MGLIFGGFTEGGEGGCCCKCDITVCIRCKTSPVIGATVTVSSGSTVITGTTGSDGCLDLGMIPTGKYTVQVSGGTPTCENTIDRVYTLHCGRNVIDCCTCPVSICVTGCPSGSPLPSALVVMTVADGSQQQCTTVLSGGMACCTIDVGGPGTYPITVSAPGYMTFFGSVNVTSCNQSITIGLKPINTPADFCISVAGCCSSVGFPCSLPGVLVTLMGQDVNQTQVTDANGQCCFWIGGGPGNYVFNMHKDRFVDCNIFVTFGQCGSLLSASCDAGCSTGSPFYQCSICTSGNPNCTCIACTCNGVVPGVCIFTYMSPDLGHKCGPPRPRPNGQGCAFLPDPVSLTLKATDSVYGAVAVLNYYDNIPLFGGSGWYGVSNPVQYPGEAACNCPAEEFLVAYVVSSCYGYAYSVSLYYTNARYGECILGQFFFINECPVNPPDIIPNCIGIPTGTLVYIGDFPGLWRGRASWLGDIVTNWTMAIPPLEITAIIPPRNVPPPCGPDGTGVPWRSGGTITITES